MADETRLIRETLEALIEGLESEDVNRRGYSAVLLERLTRQPAEFQADAPAEKRRAQVARWRELLQGAAGQALAGLILPGLLPAAEEGSFRRRRPAAREDSRWAKFLVQTLMIFTMAASLFSVFFALYLSENYRQVFPPYVPSGFLFFFFLVLLLGLLYLPIAATVWLNYRRYLQSLLSAVRRRRPPGVDKRGPDQVG